MSNDARLRPSAFSPNMVLLWLAIGLAFQLIYFGIPHPLRLVTWLHVLFWPVFVLLGMLRWVFYPFAVIAILCFAAMFAFRR
jgi:hypothetical protein